jgi:formate dehydrogenase beta subunit
VEEVLAPVGRVGLRGLGGAGFPTAQKWKFVRAEPAPRRRHQRGRGRARHVQGPALHGDGPAPRAGGHAHRRVGCRRGRRLLLPARRVRRQPRDPDARDRGALHRPAVCAAAHAPAPRRRRLHLRRGVVADRERSRASAASRGCGRRSPRRPACSAGRRSCRTSRPPTGSATSSRRRRGVRRARQDGHPGRALLLGQRPRARPGVYLAPNGITAASSSTTPAACSMATTFYGYLPGRRVRRHPARVASATSHSTSARSTSTAASSAPPPSSSCPSRTVPATSRTT